MSSSSPNKVYGPEPNKVYTVSGPQTFFQDHFVLKLGGVLGAPHNSRADPW